MQNLVNKLIILPAIFSIFILANPASGVDFDSGNFTFNTGNIDPDESLNADGDGVPSTLVIESGTLVNTDTNDQDDVGVNNFGYDNWTVDNSGTVHGTEAGVLCLDCDMDVDNAGTIFGGFTGIGLLNINELGNLENTVTNTSDGLITGGYIGVGIGSHTEGSVTNTLTNEGGIAALVTDDISAGVAIASLGNESSTTILNNTGPDASIEGTIGAVILGGCADIADFELDDEGDCSGSHEVTTTVTNSDEAEINGEVAGLIIGAVGDDVEVNVTNEDGAIIDGGSGFEGFGVGLGIISEAFPGEEGSTFNTTIINSGVGAVSGDGSLIQGYYSGISIGLTDEFFYYFDEATVNITNSGGAEIIGEGGGGEGGYGIDMYAHTYETLDVTINNTGADSLIQGQIEDGIYLDLISYDIDATVTNSLGAEISSLDSDGVRIYGSSAGVASPATFTATVTNSDTGSLIEGYSDGVEIDTGGSNLFDEVTVLVTNEDGATMRGMNDEGLDIDVGGMDVDVTVMNSNGSSIIGGDGSGTMGDEGVKIQGEAIDEVDDLPADFMDSPPNNFPADIDSFFEGTFSAAVTNTGTDSLIQGRWDGVDIEVVPEGGCESSGAVDDGIVTFSATTGTACDYFTETTINVTNSNGATIEGLNGQGVDIEVDSFHTFDVFDDGATHTSVHATFEGSGDVDINVLNMGAGSMIIGAQEGVKILAEGSDTSTVTVTNAAGATIQGGAGFNSIYFETLFDQTLNNGGTIKCDGACDGDVAVWFGEGTSTVNLFTGSDVQGHIRATDDSVAVDIINLGGTDALAAPVMGTGTGTFSYNFRNYDQVGDVLNMNGADWTLDSASGVHAVNQTNVNSGILRLGNAATTLDGDVTVNTGATFAGIGIVTGDLNGDGTVAPGLSIGTMTTGDYTPGDAGNLEIEFNEGANDLLIVDGGDGAGGTLGTTTPNGTVTFVPFNVGILPDDLTFKFIDNVDDVATAGTFDTVVLDGLGLGFTHQVLYDVDGDGDVSINIMRDETFGGILGPELPNPTEIAELIIEQAPGNPELEELIMELDGITDPEELKEFLSNLSPDELASMLRISIQETQAFVNMLISRLGGGFQGGKPFESARSKSGTQLASMGLDPSFITRLMTSSKRKTASKKNRKPSFFYRGFGTFSDLESTPGHVGFDNQSVGGGFGMDTHFSKNLTLGLAGGYSETRTNFQNTISKSNMQTGHVALFGGYTGEQWYVDSVVSYAYRDIDMNRSTATGLAISNHQANEIGVYAGGGFNLIQSDNFLFGPVASLQYISIDEEAFQETGAGASNMAFADNTTDSLRTILGVRMAQRVDLTKSVTIVPEVHLGWSHQWLDSQHSITASFVGGGTTGVNIINRPLPDDSASIGTGLAVLLGEKTALTGTYDADFGRSDFVTHTVNVDVDFQF